MIHSAYIGSITRRERKVPAPLPRHGHRATSILRPALACKRVMLLDPCHQQPCHLLPLHTERCFPRSVLPRCLIDLPARIPPAPSAFSGLFPAAAPVAPSHVRSALVLLAQPGHLPVHDGLFAVPAARPRQLRRASPARGRGRGLRYAADHGHWRSPPSVHRRCLFFRFEAR